MKRKQRPLRENWGFNFSLQATPIIRQIFINYVSFVCMKMTEDLDKLREMGMFGEMGRDGVWTVMANVMDLDSLCRAFEGCVGVFHTSAFVDPSGVSGYSVCLTIILVFWNFNSLYIVYKSCPKIGLIFDVFQRGFVCRVILLVLNSVFSIPPLF